MADKPLFDYTEVELQDAIRQKQNFTQYNISDYQRELDRRADRLRSNRSFIISILSTAAAVIALVISLIKDCSFTYIPNQAKSQQSIKSLNSDSITRKIR